MTKKTYYEKLKDPRWQKKRLEVLNNNEFTCQRCYDKESTLHVHHKEYFKGLEPWEYETNQLTVLCESCHESQHEFKDILKYVCSLLEMDGPTGRDSIGFLIAGYVGIDYQDVLNGSDYEDCSVTAAAYDIGIKASEIKTDLNKFLEKCEAKNG
jgi:hypothetical protein